MGLRMIELQTSVLQTRILSQLTLSEGSVRGVREMGEGGTQSWVLAALYSELEPHKFSSILNQLRSLSSDLL